MTRKEFLQDFWSYYLVLEEKFINTFSYVALDTQNYGTFSNEYAFLLQSVGAELDNFFKVYCGFPLSERKSINDYCSFVLDDYPEIANQKLITQDENIEFTPYQGWNKEKPSKSLFFWDKFCKIKHSRRENIKEANLKNVLYALGALYLLEMKYLSKIASNDEPDVPNKKSELFKLYNWKNRYTPMSEIYAVDIEESEFS